MPADEYPDMAPIPAPPVAPMTAPSAYLTWLPWNCAAGSSGEATTAAGAAAMEAASCRGGAVTPQPARTAADKRARGIRIKVERRRTSSR
jgi:hypothetical protein